MKTNKALLGAAIAGIMGVALSTAGAQDKPEAKKKDKKQMAEVTKCYGVNKCSGTGKCGGAGHACAGKNACKGQGWLAMPKDSCEKIEGGSLKPIEKAGGAEEKK